MEGYSCSEGLVSLFHLDCWMSFPCFAVVLFLVLLVCFVFTFVLAHPVLRIYAPTARDQLTDHATS